MDLTRLSDEELLLAVSGQDQPAFEELARRFQGRLFHFALRRLRDRQLAEDVVQEALLKVWRHAGSFRRGSRASTWIFALCLNLCRDRWRSAKPESSLERPEVSALAESSLRRDPKADASDEAAQREAAELLLQALGSLPPQSAELLKRRSQGDLTLEEAGREVGLSPQAARAAASRAYKKLRKLLEKRMERP